jgi:hypothetical protein
VTVSAAEDDIVIEAQARETPQKSSNQKSSKKSANGSLAKS